MQYRNVLEGYQVGHRTEEKLKNLVFESSSSVYILGINPWWDEGAVTVYHCVIQPKAQIREEHIDLPNIDVFCA